MLKAVNKKLVLIKTDESEAKGVIEKSEISREQEMKRQNRGTVILVGDDVTFVKKGDVVSYFRAAATDIPDGEGNVHQLVNETHVLAIFES